MEHPSVKSLRKLPHLHSYGMVQFVTFRLINSIPMKDLLVYLEAVTMPDLDDTEAPTKVDLESILDEGIGNCWLGQREIGECVKQSLLHSDRVRYDLHSWVIMPNHVHVLLCPYEGQGLAQIIHSWKSYTAKRANHLLNRSGAFWAIDYFDTFMRDVVHYQRTVAYIENNPCSAGLCKAPQDWRLSSAWMVGKSKNV